MDKRIFEVLETNIDKDNNWYDIDTLVSGLLVYLKYDIKDNTSIKDLYNNNKEDKLLKLLVANDRYKDIIFINKTIYKDKNIQFGAIKLDIDGKKCIVFMGTDGSIVGWKENFKISYEYPTLTQKYAVKYLKQYIEKDIYIIGHSKGGNLALVSSLELPKYKKKYIKGIFNLDGPGLIDSIYNSDKFNDIKDKVISYIPNESVVGILLYNYNVKVIKCRGTGFIAHSLTSWYINNMEFIPDILSDNSLKAHDYCIYALNKFDILEVKLIVETFFNSLKVDKWSDIVLDENTFKIIEELDVNKELKKYYINVFKSMLH